MERHQQLFHELSMVHKPYIDQLNEILGRYALNRPQWTIMYILFNYGPHTLVEISKYQSIEKPAITRTVNNLEQKGYIKSFSSSDKRKKNIQLTDKGEEQYKVVRSEIDEFQIGKLIGITADEQEQFLNIIKRIKQNFNE